jgi:hypothetical protein
MESAQMDNAQRFRAEWSRHYADLPPLPWILRRRALPWIRFHALPNSRRYAKDELECAVILDRANAIGDELLGDGVQCWMVETQIELDGPREFSFAWTEDEDPDAPVWHFSAQSVIWQKNAFDTTLSAIANDQCDRVLWIAGHTGAIFAPYDGGFDLFPPSWSQVTLLKEKWPEWLSSHPEGL